MAHSLLKRPWSDSFTAEPKLSDFKCPITDVVMVDPVKAQDSFFYERSNIVRHINACKDHGQPVVSPVTFEPMGEALEPADDVKVAIQKFTQVLDCHAEALRGGAPSPESETVAEDSWEVIDWGPHGLQTERRSVLSSDEAVRLDSVVRDDRSADMSQKMSAVFDQLDPIRSLLQDIVKDVMPPKIVVVGDESSGKSTLLEQLAMMSIFPRSESFCTRIAISVRLRRNPDPAVARAVLSVCSKDGAQEVLHSSETSVPIHQGHKYVQAIMTKLVGEAAGTGVLTSHYIVMYVYHPDVPSIDLVDLPGFTNEAGRAAEVEQIVEGEVQEDERTGGHSMFLVIVPAMLRPNTNLGLSFIKRHNLQSRAFGVFSQCDVPGKNTPDVLRSLMTGHPTKQGKPATDIGYVELNQGWIATMLAPPSNADYPEEYYELHSAERLYEQKRAEQEFFSGDRAHGILKELCRAGRTGVPALVDVLSAKYLDYLNSTWVPTAMRKVTAIHQEKCFARAMLGQATSEEVAMGLAAAAEVEKRLDPQVSEGIQGFYDRFVESVHSELRESLTCAIRPLSEHQLVAHDRLAKHAEQVRTSVCSVIDSFLQQKPLLEGIRQLLTVEVKVEEDQKGMSLKHVWNFITGLSRGQLHETVKQRPPFQLCRFPHYTRAILEKCDKIYDEAIEEASREASDIARCLVSFTSKWVTYTTSPEKLGIIINCNVERAVETLLSMVLARMPNQHSFSHTHVGIPLGTEDAANVARRSALDEEILKIEAARAGIIAVLKKAGHEITQEQLDAYVQEYIGQA